MSHVPVGTRGSVAGPDQGGGRGGIKVLPVGRKARGITLLEIMVAMSILSVVLVAFASVFPSGYRLNFSNENQTKAATYATTIADQVSLIPVSLLQGPLMPQSSPPQTYNNAVTALMGLKSNLGQLYLSLPPGLSVNAIDSLPNNTTNSFWLQAVYLTNLNNAALPDDLTQSPPITSAQQTAAQAVIGQIEGEEVTVVIRWVEERKNKPNILKNVTVTTFVNSVTTH